MTAIINLDYSKVYRCTMNTNRITRTLSKLSLILCFVSLNIISLNSNAQLGGKIKSKTSSVKKAYPSSKTSDNQANKGIHEQPPLEEIWQPQAELITDPAKITPEYCESLIDIKLWIHKDRLTNDERRHIWNLFQRIGNIAKKAYTQKMGTFSQGDRLEFQIKDMEVIRYEAINRGERPSVDGTYHHMEGFLTNWYCPKEVYNTPFHAELRKWFEVAKAIVEYDLKRTAVWMWYKF